jgi:hypothetical protein
MQNNEIVGREIFEWAFLILDADDEHDYKTAKIMGYVSGGSFIITSKVARKIDDRTYQTQSGTFYSLSGDPNKEVANSLYNTLGKLEIEDLSFGLGKYWFAINE